MSQSSSVTKFFLHASNVHNGGGLTLLCALLKVIDANTTLILTVDDRVNFSESLAKNIQIKRVKPTVSGRFSAERWLARNVAPKDIVLCFGNLPPLFKLRAKCIVFVQNRYLIENVSLDRFSFKDRWRLIIERFWLFRAVKNVNAFIVQTPSMKGLLEIKIAARVPVYIYPFVAFPEGYSRHLLHAYTPKVCNFNFVYIASGEPHKNHYRLIEAWCLLAKEGLFPSLKLTVDEFYFSELCSRMKEKIFKFKINIENCGTISREQVAQLYRDSDALIYPSVFESFGLPLIEARQAGLPVLASELDYVRDVLDPEQVFDPSSATSIARAVKRFMEIEESPLRLQDGVGFIKNVLRIGGQ